MDRWLVTFAKSADLQKLLDRFVELGAIVQKDQPVVPLGDDELAIELAAPEPVSREIADEDDVAGVYPSSDMSLY